MHPALARATAGVLSRLGEDALLRGVATTHKVQIHQGVDVYDNQGDLVYAEYVATISNVDQPRKGDALVQNGVTYVLERRLDDNGYSSRFVLNKQ